jgi:type IV pilus assembly protein PilA
MNLVSKWMKGFTWPTLSLEKVKNQKGLTLIELLAIIVIIAVIGAIAVPAINNVVRSTERNAHRANAHMIVDAARKMIALNSFTKTGSDGTNDVQDITFADLVSKGHLQTLPTDPFQKPKTYEGADSIIRVTKTTTGSGVGQVDKFTYKITLVGNDGTNDIKYMDAVEEGNIDSTTINGG